MTFRPAGFGVAMSHCSAIFFVDNLVLSFCAGMLTGAVLRLFSGMADVPLDVTFCVACPAGVPPPLIKEAEAF